jgi:ADP-heptose:LPS heptosyltransferase
VEKSNAPSDHILVLRFSAMGDVALATPVIKSLAQAYPSKKISVVTRPKFGVFFHGIPNVNVIGVDLDKNYKGFGGIFRLFGDLRKHKPTLVIDIHDHLRTKLLRFFFGLTKVKTIVFEKGRPEKKKAVQPKNKLRGQLLHTVVRYQRVFERVGLKFSFVTAPYLAVKKESDDKLQQWVQTKNVKAKIWIGVAPFAAHQSKMWPLEKYQQVIEKLSASGLYHFFLFGGGKLETEQLEALQNKIPNVTSTAGELGLNRELALIEKLSLMLCGDSSNMHLAALLNVPVVSVWGGTHPHLGFGPWGQGDEAIVQVSVEELPCRPCSVYGTSKCLRGDFACLMQVTPEVVAARVLERLK